MSTEGLEGSGRRESCRRRVWRSKQGPHHAGSCGSRGGTARACGKPPKGFKQRRTWFLSPQELSSGDGAS